MKLLDHNGNPIDAGALREPQTADTAHLAREFDQHPARGLSPARLNTLMQAAEQGDIIGQIDLADDMEERDGHLYAEIDKRKGAVASLEYSIVEPDGASAAEKALAAQLREWLAAIDDFEDLVRGTMDGALKAFSNHELVWALQDGVLIPRITFRPQRWFCVDKATRNEMRLRTLGTADGEPLRPFSWISHIHKTRNGYLARGGLVRVLAWPYLFKNFATRDLAEFLEIYGLPLRLGRYPAGASDDEKRTLLQAVTQIGHNAAGIIPQSMAIEFNKAADGTEGPFGSMIERMDAVESKVILGQTLTASEGQHGTQALGQVHNEVRMDIRNSDARQVEATLTRQLLWPMAALNVAGADPRRVPRFVFDTSEPEDMKLYADALPKLVNIGFQIDRKWAQDKLRMPEPEQGADALASTPVAVPVAEGQPGGAKAPPPGKRAALAAQVLPAAGRDAIDDVVDEALADWRPQLAPLVEPLLAEADKAIAAGESLAAFAARLPQLVEHMDGRPMADQLARRAFITRLAGEADLDLTGSEG